MLHINSKKISLSLCLCALTALSTPALSQVDSAIVLAASDTGSIAAKRAAEQKEALAKKAAEREAKKAATSQAPVETAAPTPPAEELKEK